MSCKIEINYPQPKDEAVQKLKDAVMGNGGTFEGNVSKGHFKVPTPIGSFEIEYTIDGDLITIIVLKKPFVISCERIEKEIYKYLEDNSISINTQDNYLNAIKQFKYENSNEKKYNKEVKLLQEENHKEVRKLMSKYLTTLSHFDTAEGDISFKVKRVILNVKGNYSTDPNQLMELLNLKKNLLYNANDYIMLAIKLNEFIVSPDSKITMAEMNKCKTVGDCIALVNKKIQIS
ncbi:hypothetical protein [Flavobacterium sp.]|uniref:hypothetical protein n=1 Tax=Flavobacterium sp. TaxID=239 RepID=UPI003D6A1693